MMIIIGIVLIGAGFVIRRWAIDNHPDYSMGAAEIVVEHPHLWRPISIGSVVMAATGTVFFITGIIGWIW